eukprot:3181789-Prymnesium_polylepis.1
MSYIHSGRIHSYKCIQHHSRVDMLVRSPKSACVLAFKRASTCGLLHELDDIIAEGENAPDKGFSLSTAQQVEDRVTAHLKATHEVRLREGARVRVHGLTTAHTLNGKEGQLLFFIKTAGRWAVRIIRGEDVRIKPANLQLEQLDICGRLGESGDLMKHILSSMSIVDLTAFAQASAASRTTVLQQLQLGIHHTWAKPMPSSVWPEIRRKYPPGDRARGSKFRLEIVYEKSSNGRGRYGVPMPTDAFVDFTDLLIACRAHELDIASVTRLVTALCDTHTFDWVGLEVHDAMNGYGYGDAYIIPAARVAGELVAHNWSLQWKGSTEEMATLIHAVAERMEGAYKKALSATAQR